MSYKHPRLYLTPQQFEELPEYSCTMPTGTTPGKRWRRRDGAHDIAFIRRGGKPKWFVLEYSLTGFDGIKAADNKIFILWYKPVIRIPNPGRSVQHEKFKTSLD